MNHSTKTKHYYYQEFDKMLSENEPEYLKQRLEYFGVDDYSRWFIEPYEDIVICVDQWLEDGSLEHWHLINN